MQKQSASKEQLESLMVALDEAIGIVEKIPGQVPFRRIEDYLAASKMSIEIELGYTAPGAPPVITPLVKDDDIPSKTKRGFSNGAASE